MNKVIIVGGGAAGMMAAISASKAGKKVCILEKNEKNISLFTGFGHGADPVRLCKAHAYCRRQEHCGREGRRDPGPGCNGLYRRGDGRPGH